MGTIDDVQFLRDNSVEESYLFIVDSDTRDRRIYPEPNLYAVQFDSPFQNVIGIDIIDGTIPRTQYAVDTVCNRLCIDYGKGPMTIDVTTGDHTDTSLISDINSKLSALPGCTVSARSVSTPPELKNLITFTAPNIPFHIFADERSTIKPVIGFDEYAANHRYLGSRFSCRDPVHAPATYSSIAKDMIPASTFSTQDAADTVIPFADPSSPTVPRLVGIRFGPEQSGLIDRITLAFNVVAPSAGAVTFYLAADDEVESAPGAPLCPPTPVAAQEFGDHGLTTLRFQTEIGLTVGRNAWLVVSAREPSDGLYAGSSGNALVKASSDGGASWGGWTSGGWNPLMNVQVTQSTQTIIGPGILNLVGDSYCILRCDEIESHTLRSRAFEKYTFGLARFTLAVVGFATSRLDYNAVTPRRVHPINSLSTFTFRFVRPDGVTLYDFKGVNHSIIASIRYLVPKPTAAFDDKILNPGYEPNPLLGYAAVTTDSDPDSTADPDEDDELDEVLGNPTANDGFWSNDYRPIDPEYW
jgi:hypothetical protein